MSVVKDWITKAGLRAVVWDTSDVASWMTHLNGYVAVPLGHPLHGQDYDTPLEFLEMPLNEEIGKRGVIPLFCGAVAAANGEKGVRPEVAFDVHGSLTYAGKDGYPLDTGSSAWWFGFDCNHSGDYRAICNEGYVEAECERLAQQLADVLAPEAV